MFFIYLKPDALHIFPKEVIKTKTLYGIIFQI